MAKKKAAPASAKNPAAAPKKTASEAKANAAAAVRLISIDEIGAVSGEIWQLLHERGEQTLAAVKKEVNASSDLVTAAVGWLAREGKLGFATSGRSVKISLR